MNTKPSLKRLSANMIKKLLQLIEERLKQLPSKKRKRGRPKVYSDSFILLIYFIKVLRNYSFRDTVFYLEEILGEKIPSISTLHYRFSKLEILHFEELFERVLGIFRVDEMVEIELMVVDGRGFGYNDKRKLNWMRGKKIREVSSHVKVELVVGRMVNGKDVILGVAMGRVYSDERKLLEGMIGKVKARSKYMLGDALYGMSVKVLRKLFEKAERVIVPIKDTLHTRVRDPIRKKVKRMYEENKEEYRNRYIVEQVIGKIKNAYGQWEGTKSLEMAKKSIWAKVIAYNWVQVMNFFVFLLRWMTILHAGLLRYASRNFRTHLVLY